MINADEIIDSYNKNLVYVFDNSKELEELRLELWGYRQAILRDDKLLGLQLQINELQARIDKAIEHINNCLFDYEEDSIIGEDFNLAKRILMGDDKE